MREIKQLSTKHIITVTVTAIAGLAVSYVLDVPFFTGFSVGLLLLLGMLLRTGLRFRDAMHTAAVGALHTKEVVYILLFVGLLIPAWSASGTIKAMIGLGINSFVPAYFLTSAFLLSAVIAFLLGTSTGTLSAVGIPIIGMAMQLGVPLPVTAGALVSGAFVGDRGSPFSSAFRLVADSVGISTRRLGKAMLPTTIAGLALSIAFFGAADYFGDWAGTGFDGTAELSADSGVASFWLFVPPILLVGTMLLRLGTRKAFIFAIVSGVIIGTWKSGIAIGDWPAILWNGWTEPLGEGVLHTAKGVENMMGLVTLIALAGSFNGLLERSGAIEPIVRKVFARSIGLADSTVRAGGFGLSLGLVSCTQTLPIMMSGRHLRVIWEPRFGTSHLGRVVADTSLLLAALVPWNMLAILCSTIIGVPVTDYVPYAVYIWSIPLFTLAYSYIARPRVSVHTEQMRKQV